MAVAYPPRGSSPWDLTLKSYIDTIVDAMGLSSTSSVAGSLGPFWAALARRTTDTAKIVHFGSSTTAGTGASDPTQTSWVAQYGKRLQAAYPSGTGTEPPYQTLSQAFGTPYSGPGVQVINGGIASTTSANYVSGIALLALGSINPDLVVHMIGSNDSTVGPYFVSVADYEINLKNAIDQIDSISLDGTPVCHMLVHTFRRSSVTRETWAAYLAVLRKIERERGNVLVVDASEAWEQARHLGGDPFDLVSADLVHPTDFGHWLLAETVSLALRIPGGGGGGSSAAGKIDSLATLGNPPSSPFFRRNLNYTLSTAQQNLSEIAINGVVRSWTNEWGALRGRIPYSNYNDALARAIIEAGDTVQTSGNAFEIVDRRKPAGDARQTWGRRWSDGRLVRNGHLMVDVYIHENPEAPLPTDLPVPCLILREEA